MLVLLLFSSLHSFSTGFRSEDWNDHRKSLVSAKWPIFVFLRFVFGLLSGWKIQAWLIIRFITESVYNLLVFDRIHDAMCLNKMSRTSTSKIQQYVSLYTWVLFYPCVHKTQLQYLLLKSNFLVTIEASPISPTEYAGDCFVLFAFSFLEFFSWSPHKQHVVM